MCMEILMQDKQKITLEFKSCEQGVLSGKCQN